MTFLTPAQLMQLGKKCFRCEKNAKWLDKDDQNAPAYCDEHYPDYDGAFRKEKKKNIVYIIYMTSKNMIEILGVYSSLKLAEEKSNDFQRKHRTGTSRFELSIIERQVDE